MMLVPGPKPGRLVRLNVPPRARLLVTATLSQLVPHSNQRPAELFRVRLLLMLSVPMLPGPPGASAPPAFTVTAPLIKPVPPSVPPLLTVTVLVATP